MLPRTFLAGPSKVNSIIGFILLQIIIFLANCKVPRELVDEPPHHREGPQGGERHGTRELGHPKLIKIVASTSGGGSMRARAGKLDI